MIGNPCADTLFAKFVGVAKLLNALDRFCESGVERDWTLFGILSSWKDASPYHGPEYEFCEAHAALGVGSWSL